MPLRRMLGGSGDLTQAGHDVQGSLHYQGERLADLAIADCDRPAAVLGFVAGPRHAQGALLLRAGDRKWLGVEGGVVESLALDRNGDLEGGRKHKVHGPDRTFHHY